MRNRALMMLLTGLLCFSSPLMAENYTLKGDMDSSVRYGLSERITAGDGIQRLVLSFVVPESFQSPTYRQEVQDFHLRFQPEAQEKTTVRDKRGNLILTATWSRPPRVVEVSLSCTATSRTNLSSVATSAPFPMTRTGGVENADYLLPTAQVQSSDPRIRHLAEKLTQGVQTQFDAVQRIVSWVVDHVSYVTPPVRYDAVYALESGRGNCQNYSHLSAALLRAMGIPVRIVNGVTLNRPLDIRWAKGILTFKMGQGRHSWIEVWFPDLGWVPFDAQNSVLFVSNRFIRIEVGIDNEETKNDGLLRWVQAADAGQPSLQESIHAGFDRDRIEVTGVRENYGPKNLLLTPTVLASFKQLVVPPPVPLPEIPEEEKKHLRYTVPFLFGNLSFPEDVDFAFPRTTTATGVNRYEMKKNFLVETAEYVTRGVTQYAQGFVLKKPVKLQKVGMALHKFGGEGFLWADLFQDRDGKPGALLATSDMVELERLSLKPGYRWQDFSFSKDGPELMPGRFWIALGFSGSPVVNWYYTYGKPVGPVDGTRYKGVFEQDWSGALGYEFNYRIVGLTVK